MKSKEEQIREFQEEKTYIDEKDKEVRISQIREEIVKCNQYVRELHKEIGHIRAAKYHDMVGKFYKVNHILGGYYIYVYEVFDHEEGVIVRGVSFTYAKTGFWDDSLFSWRADDDFIISDLDAPSYTFEEVTKEVFEKKFDEYYKSLKEYSANMLLKAINDWTDKKK